MAGNEHRSRGQRRPTDTSWDRIAGWYDGWVGSLGSQYHRELAIPAVLELLVPKPGESILDIGAGQGALASSIARSAARYTGIDTSARLIALARRRHGHLGRFLVGDGSRLHGLSGVGPAAHDAAVFMLSIQDMDPFEPVLTSVAWALRRSSRIVILMTHPAFRIPRHSGWGFDPSRKLSYRRVDRYLSPMAVPMRPVGREPPTRSFHRPLSDYVNGLGEVGFAVDAMLEIPDLPPESRPSVARRSSPANADIPLFLGLRAVRG
ncbi:MAG: methyltransferase domain-containing protein [Chloroflexi bacterium]|nr:methyltransferase domain-containing protein [Chloroflexota bacterium]